ncbi:hypothetical protein [Gracilimonas mengyeensis]|uniref:Flagellar protein n=1 Tax=Gracilimonas mengyeensis TaxID=1302730 RepID=A0A521EC35_9BACT|nr:hypothetical protein [Gracilimonas mengyeensis]SMO81496.1 hypothetical protein SAMN06265219_111100 [Gracilimonas mengyeensis]
MDVQKIISQSDKSPKSILKIVLSISVALLLIWLFLVSRMDTGSSSKSVNADQKIEQTQQLRTSLLKPGEEIKEKPEEAVQEEESSSSLFQNAFLTFLVMIGVLAGVWLWAKKKDDGLSIKNNKPNRDLGSHKLSQGLQLKFVEINKEVWVMGVAENSVNLMHRILKEEWMENEMKIDSKAVEPKSVQKTVNDKGDFKSFYKFFTN